MSKKRRKPKKLLGDHLIDLETTLNAMIDENDLQWGDVFGLVRQHLEVHRPDAQEKYVRGGHPEFYYGPRRKR